MPKLIEALPKYRLHKASGQAIVTLSGRDHYLGPHGTKASRLEYDRLIAEWLHYGRQAPNAQAATITVVELCSRYLRFAQGYYQKDGRPTPKRCDEVLVQFLGGDWPVVLRMPATRRRFEKATSLRHWQNSQHSRRG